MQYPPNQPTDQPPYYPQQPYGYGQPPQLPPPRKSRRRMWLIIGAIVIGLIILSSIGNAVKGNQGSPTDSPTATPQPVATHAPIVAQPRLGSPVSAFTAKYGTPATLGVGGYTFNSGSITVTAQPNDGSVYGTHVLSILIDAPSQGWTETEAINACSAFLPVDATYTGVGTLSSNNAGTGKERLYFSLSLIKQFPKSEFIDSDLNPTKPGTFAIILNYFSGSTTSFASCAIQTQLE